MVVEDFASYFEWLGLERVFTFDLSDPLAGAWIYLIIEEMGIQGPALVKSIEACPALAGGPGRLVLSTMKSVAHQIIEIGSPIARRVSSSRKGEGASSITF